MALYIVSDRECAVDGVGILTPGKPVEVDVELFKMYHGVGPSEANLPHYVVVSEKHEEVEKDKEEKQLSVLDVIKTEEGK